MQGDIVRHRRAARGAQPRGRIRICLGEKPPIHRWLTGRRLAIACFAISFSAGAVLWWRQYQDLNRPERRAAWEIVVGMLLAAGADPLRKPTYNQLGDYDNAMELATTKAAAQKATPEAIRIRDMLRAAVEARTVSK